jgi:PhnB protein
MSVKPVPEGYHTITPYLIVDGAAGALEFYRTAFGGQEVFRMPMGDKIGHAEMRIGDSVVMLADQSPDMGYLAPGKGGNTPVGLMLYVDDVDTVFQRALSAGARQERPVQNQFYGDRSGTLVDPFGHRWNIATHVEDVAPEEMKRRMQEFTKPTSS